MKFTGHKTSKVLFVFVAGVCLTAATAVAAESSSATGARKPAPHLAASRTTSTHPVAKKGAAASHLAAQHRTVATSRAAHHTAGRATARAYTTPVKGTPGPAGSASLRKGTSARYRSTHRARPRTSSGQQRLAHLHMAPERVQEIQHALIAQGYMQGEPTGEWDATTRDAMLRYQSTHGFPPTGLPEAKSLMKLGLGPHPLSPELDHGQVTAANAGVTTPVQNVFIRTPNAPPDSPSSPATLGAIVPETK